MVGEFISHTDRVVHVRFEGRSQDIPFSMLDVGDLSSDQDVCKALARYFDVSEGKFSPYVVERHPNGNMTVRPEAIFG
jgi:hypothetical protein